MFLSQLVYVSTAKDICKKDIEAILASSRKNNKKVGVTGILLFNRKYFLQYLEGQRSHINHIYHKILNDDRHKEPLMLHYTECSERNFAVWDMKYASEQRLNREKFFAYSINDEFNPYLMSGESALGLIKSFKTEPDE